MEGLEGEKNNMKVLVTGSEGYIGTVLVQKLLEKGFDVVGLDTGFYRDGLLYDGITPPKKVVNKDIRQVRKEDLEGFDAVIHLAELSNDPLGQINSQITYEINHKGSVNLAKKAKAAGIPKFIYMSSCSAYGIAKNGVATEEVEVHPQTNYAKCKILSEEGISKLASDNFSPTFLRSATVFGASPRMRFDIVLNNLAGLAFTEGEIKMHSDGTPWRPLIHVLDICQAIAMVLTTPKEVVHNQIINVGDDSQNYQVKEIAKMISEVFPDCQIKFGKNDPDNRSYKVSFEKIGKLLPEFKCRHDAKAGAKELFELFKRINLDKETFYSKNFTRLKQIEHLVKTNKIDRKFFWRKP